MPWKSLRMSDNFARDRSANVFTDKYDEKKAAVLHRCLRPSRNPSFVSSKTGVLNRFWTKIEEI